MVNSSSGHMMKGSWPITTGDLRCIYQLEKGAGRRGGVDDGRMHMYVFYVEVGYLKLGIVATSSPSSSSSASSISSLLIFLLSVLKQLHSPVPWVPSCKLNEAESLC